MRVGGINVKNISYVDDTVPIADTAEKLQKSVTALNRTCVEKGTDINVRPGKTEVMRSTKRREDLDVNILLNGMVVPKVYNYTYLGKTESEVIKRIGMAKTSFGNVRKVLTNMDSKFEIRLRLLKCFVWSVLLYGSEP